MDPRWSSPPYPYPQPPPRPAYPYQGAPDGLMLAGAITGIALGVLMSLMMVLELVIITAVEDIAQREGGPEASFFPFNVFMGMFVVFLVLAIVGIVGAALVFSGRGRLRTTLGAEGRSRTIAGAILMMCGPAMIGGILALVGVLLVSPPPGMAANPARFDR